MLPASTAASRRNGYALVLYVHPPTTQQSRGHFHIPAHMLSMHPFTYPFTYGNNACITTDGSHVGMNPPGNEPVAGMLSGSTSREFMVLVESTFIVLNPKKVNLSLHGVLFPSSKTHTVSFGKKGRSYPLRPGSVIMAQTDDVLRSVTVFLAEHEHYSRATRALTASINHFALVYKRLVSPSTTPHPFFDPTAPRLVLTAEWGVVQDPKAHSYLNDYLVAAEGTAAAPPVLLANVKRGGDERAAMNSADGKKNISAEPDAKSEISTEPDANKRSSMQPPLNKISGSSNPKRISGSPDEEKKISPSVSPLAEEVKKTQTSPSAEVVKRAPGSPSADDVKKAPTSPSAATLLESGSPSAPAQLLESGSPSAPAQLLESGSPSAPALLESCSPRAMESSAPPMDAKKRKAEDDLGGEQKRKGLVD